MERGGVPLRSAQGQYPHLRAFRRHGEDARSKLKADALSCVFDRGEAAGACVMTNVCVFTSVCVHLRASVCS